MKPPEQPCPSAKLVVKQSRTWREVTESLVIVALVTGMVLTALASYPLPAPAVFRKVPSP